MDRFDRPAARLVWPCRRQGSPRDRTGAPAGTLDERAGGRTAADGDVRPGRAGKAGRAGGLEGNGRQAGPMSVKCLAILSLALFASVLATARSSAQDTTGAV